jgi:peptidoglycan-associated lipoprotein
MRILRTFLLVALAVSMSACACRTKHVGGNIPVAGEGGPLKDIHFAFDSSALDATAKDILKANADWLKANPSAKVQVEGHCDERGTNEYNMVLGGNRSHSGASYLAGLGIDKSRVSTVSYGEELPLDPAHNESAWAKNRRAHFNVSGAK